MSRAISPPKVAAMESAWSILEELGAVDLDGRLTALGKHMVCAVLDFRDSLTYADIPLLVHVARRPEVGQGIFLSMLSYYQY